MIFDSNLKFHINSVVKSYFFQLRAVAKLKRVLSFKVREVVIHAFMSSRLDYCNSLYYSISHASLSRQSKMLQLEF